MPTAPDLITQDDLAAWLGYRPEQTARIRRRLERDGIRYTLGRGGRVCTTAQAVNAAILEGRDDAGIEFEPPE